jgi:hypothetical protein
MRVFIHISEFGDLGWASLPAAVLLTKRVTVWAPSFHELRMAGGRSATILEPKHLLELIALGRVQVMARQDWIFDKARRNTDPRWAHARWHDQYDNELRRLAESPSDPDPDSQAVRIMPEEQGLVWSESLTSRGQYYRRASVRYGNAELPSGILERARRHAAQGGDPVRSVLRDVKDHEDAFEASQTWAPLEPSDYPDAVAHIMRRRSTSDPRPLGDYEQGRVRELIRAAGRIAHLRSGDDLVKRVKKHAHEDFAGELGEFLVNDRTAVAGRIRAKIEAGARPTLQLTLGRALVPRSKFEGILTGGSLVAALASISLATPELAITSALSLSFWAVQTLQRAGQVASVLPSEYTGPTLPFMLAYGTTRPTLEQIRSLMKELETLY